MNPKFINFYKNIANETAKLSRGVRLKVGAIAVKDNRIISYGYNGLPPGDDSPLEYRDYLIGGTDFDGNYMPEIESMYPLEDASFRRYRLVTKPEVIHAECNLICKLAQSDESAKGCSVFLTHSPCTSCATMMVATGVKKVYYINEYRSSTGIDILQRHGVEVEKIDE